MRGREQQLWIASLCMIMTNGSRMGGSYVIRTGPARGMCRAAGKDKPATLLPRGAVVNGIPRVMDNGMDWPTYRPRAGAAIQQRAYDAIDAGTRFFLQETGAGVPV